MSYVPPHKRHETYSYSSYSSSSWAPEPQPTIKAKTVIAGQDYIDTEEILKKTENLSMAEKLALAATSSVTSSTTNRSKQALKRQKELKQEKEASISDKAFYEDQVTESAMPLQMVHMDSSVLMQIVQHAENERFESARGQLLGSITKGILTISTAFPQNEHDRSYPQHKARAQMDNQYAFENVGWYSSSDMDSYLSMTNIETQYQYQRESGKRCIFLVHDVTSIESKGCLGIRAFRLSEKFMSLVREIAEHSTASKKASNKQQDEILKKQIQRKIKYDGLPSHLPNIDLTLISKRMALDSIFEEVPIEVHNNVLVDSFLYSLRSELESESLDTQPDIYDLNTRGTLQRRLGELYASQKDLKKRMSNEHTHHGVEVTVIKERIMKHLRSLDSDTLTGSQKLRLVDSIVPKRS